jgi:predicted transcriptional regulator
MEIPFPPEFEAKISRLAAASGRNPNQLVLEIVQSYIEHDQWFREQVSEGLEQLDQGISVSHDEVVARIERMFRS